MKLIKTVAIAALLVAGHAFADALERIEYKLSRVNCKVAQSNRGVQAPSTRAKKTRKKSTKKRPKNTRKKTTRRKTNRKK